MSRLWRLHPGVRSGDELTFGERAADLAVRSMGSWAFLWAQTGIMAVWVLLNTVAPVHHWDPYSFTLLNLGLSMQAAFAAPLILLAGVRADAKRAELALHTHENTQRLLQVTQRSCPNCPEDNR